MANEFLLRNITSTNLLYGWFLFSFFSHLFGACIIKHKFSRTPNWHCFQEILKVNCGITLKLKFTQANKHHILTKISWIVFILNLFCENEKVVYYEKNKKTDARRTHWQRWNLCHKMQMFICSRRRVKEKLCIVHYSEWSVYWYW